MRYRLRTLLILLVAGPTVLLPIARADDPQSDSVKKELNRLQGEWLLVYWRFNGKDLDAAKELGEVGEKTTLTFTNNRFVIKVGEKVYEEGTAEIDPNTSPPTFDSTVTMKEGQKENLKTPGIYLLNDDLFIACVSYDEMKPRAFSAERDSHRELVVYRRK